LVKRLKQRFKQVYRQGPVDAELQEQAMAEWYRSDLGNHLLSVERDLVTRAISGRFGSIIAQLDSGFHEALFEKRLFGSGIIVSQLENRALNPVVLAEPEQLPFEPESLDMVLMHHTLDICNDPYQVVRESAIALRPGGLLIVLGFNPFSLWGLRALVQGRSGNAGVWSSRFIRSGRVEDWMHLLDFELERHERHHFVPPYNEPPWLAKMNVLTPLQRNVLMFSGAVYLLVGYKQVAGRIHSLSRNQKMSFLDTSVSGRTTARTKF